jgi:hypothetical protein
VLGRGAVSLKFNSPLVQYLRTDTVCHVGISCHGGVSGQRPKCPMWWVTSTRQYVERRIVEESVFWAVVVVDARGRDSLRLARRLVREEQVL